MQEARKRGFDVSQDGFFKGEIINNAYGYGNILCLVNDPARDLEVEAIEQGQENVNVATVSWNSFPFHFMYVSKPIAAGDF